MLYNYTLPIPLVLLAASAQADVPRVVVDIAPVHSLVATVMGGLGAPDLLVEPGATPHSFSLRPSQASALEQADAVFWVGEAMTPWLEGPLEELAGDAAKVELLEADGTVTFPFREGPVFADDHHEGDHGHDDHADKDEHDHGDEHAEEHGEEHAYEGEHHHDHDGVDPHAWLDPENGKAWLSAIAAELSRLDPDNADTYASNAVAGQDRLTALSAEITATLTDARSNRYVVFHDAYQYFEARFGLTSVGAISLGDASAPSPARLQALRDELAEQSVACAFSEPQFNPGLVRSVVEGSDAGAAVLDPLGAALPIGPSLYPDLLGAMAQSIADCAATSG